MKLRKLEIDRMPGFEKTGFPLEGLSEGLNLIIGPNASGKTIACRAIRGLLWPETLRDLSPVSIVGEWIEDEHVMRIGIEGERLTHQRDGSPAQPPPLPAPHLATCFTISIDDLFEESETDTSLADSVVREMAGGYDINAVRQLNVFKLPGKHGRKEFDELRLATQQARTIKAEQENLSNEEDELEDLERKETEAQNAQARLGRFADARELIDVRDKIKLEQNVVDGLPSGMGRLRGDEAERLEQIQGDLDAGNKALQDASAAATDAELEKARADLPEEGVPDTAIREQKSRVETLRTTEGKLDDARSRVREADEELKSAIHILGNRVKAEKLDFLDLEGLDEIEAFHRDSESIESRRSALAGRLAALDEEKSENDIDALTNGIGILREWFEVGPRESAAHDRNLIMVWALAGVIALIGGVLGILISPWFALLTLIAGVAALAARVTGKSISADLRGECQARYDRLSLKPPSAWDPAAIGKHLNTLEQSLAQARQAHERDVERKSCKAQLDQLEKEIQPLASRRTELIERFGVSPNTSTLALSIFAMNLRQYQRARTTRDVCQGEVDKLESTHHEQLRTINAFLVEFAEKPCDSYDVGQVRSEAIFERANMHREARRKLATANRNEASAGKDIEKVQTRRRTLLEALGLDEDDEAGLYDRLELLTAYREADAKLKDLKAQEALLLLKLKDAPKLLQLTAEQVEAEEIRVKSMAEGYRGLVERIAGIRDRIDAAARGTRLEEAVARVNEVTEHLRDRREEASLAAAGVFLLDEAEAEHQAESRPQVLRQAETWFAMFTRGRYELRMATPAQSASSAFRAYDTTSGRGLALDELSRGTRMQLILAVRLAFAAEAERETQIPFVLDEVLSSSDPVRFRAIIEALLALVNDGRQVFYFTCQPGDADAWRKVAGEMGITDARLFNLAEIQLLERPASDLLSDSTVHIDHVLEPGTATLGEYAKALSVPDLDPMAGARAAHVAHLVERAEQLHQLLEAGIQTYGQLRVLASHSKVDAYVPQDVLTRMEARACVLDAFAEARRIGKGRPVSREVLAAAGVSDSYIDGVTDLARELNWDAKRLVTALHNRNDDRAKGFRRSSLELVRENLSESGHLDIRQEFDEDEVFSRVLAAANDFVKRATIDSGEVRRLFARLWDLSREPYPR